MTKEYEIGDADHALDRNQQFGLLRGNGHIEGGPAVLDDEASPPTVTAPTPWSVYVDGETVEVDGDENTVELPQPHPTLDRWDVIYVDPDGELQVESGEPAEAIGERGLQAREPAPSSFAEIDGVVIAAAYRQFDEADGAAFALSELFFDRRVRTLADVESLRAENATVESAPESEADVVRKLEADALEDNINSLDTAFTDHSARHQNDGADELNLDGLSGDLADPQDPKDHQERHHEGAADEIAEGALTRQDPTNHGERHHDGGPDAIAADQLTLDGSENRFLSGVGWAQVPNGSDIEIFETSGTWEKPEEVNMVFIDVVGAGGGGAGDRGGGGGGGGRFMGSFNAVSLPETVDIVVGAGGAPGDDDNPDSEGGGNSAFGDLEVGGGGGATGNNGGEGGDGGDVIAGPQDGDIPLFDGGPGGPFGDNPGSPGVFGGGGGGARDSNGTGQDGGDAYYAGGGGASSGAIGGGSLSYTSGSATNTTPGANGETVYGSGEGGNGSDDAGGDGGFPGGGGASGSTFEPGGTGGDGIVRIATW